MCRLYKSDAANLQHKSWSMNDSPFKGSKPHDSQVGKDVDKVLDISDENKFLKCFTTSFERYKKLCR